MKIYSESRLADKKKIQLFDSGNEKEKTRQPTMAKTFIASKSWLRRLEPGRPSSSGTKLNTSTSEATQHFNTSLNNTQNALRTKIPN